MRRCRCRRHDRRRRCWRDRCVCDGCRGRRFRRMRCRMRRRQCICRRGSRCIGWCKRFRRRCRIGGRRGSGSRGRRRWCGRSGRQRGWRVRRGWRMSNRGGWCSRRQRSRRTGRCESFRGCRRVGGRWGSRGGWGGRWHRSRRMGRCVRHCWRIGRCG